MPAGLVLTLPVGVVLTLPAGLILTLPAGSWYPQVPSVMQTAFSFACIGQCRMPDCTTKHSRATPGLSPAVLFACRKITSRRHAQGTQTVRGSAGITIRRRFPASRRVKRRNSVAVSTTASVSSRHSTAGMRTAVRSVGAPTPV